MKTLLATLALGGALVGLSFPVMAYPDSAVPVEVDKVDAYSYTVGNTPYIRGCVTFKVRGSQTAAAVRFSVAQVDSFGDAIDRQNFDVTGTFSPYTQIGPDTRGESNLCWFDVMDSSANTTVS